MGVWLVTWEYAGESGQEDRIAALLDYRLGEKSVRRIVELLYASSYYTLQERLDHAKGKFHPYPARAVKMPNGLGAIECGHNPYLLAQIVDDVSVYTDDDGKEQIAYELRTRDSWLAKHRKQNKQERKRKEKEQR